ncbi:hypothetical protein Hanom_Chr08g00738311 [Helianthus anomalus]
MLVHHTLHKPTNKFQLTLSLSLIFRPRAPTFPPPSFQFNLAIRYTFKCEGSRVRKLGAYGLPRTSPQRY